MLCNKSYLKKITGNVGRKKQSGNQVLYCPAQRDFKGRRRFREMTPPLKTR